MRFRNAFVLALSFALALIASPVIAGEVGNELHTGLYTDDFYADPDLNGVGNAAGQKVTFGGTFHNVGEINGPATAEWSNTREILESVWRGKATPFANVGTGASAASIAAGNYDAKIADWVTHVKSYLEIGAPRSLIVAPLPEHNGDWTSHGCDPTNFKIAYGKFVDAFRRAGLDETKVRFAWAPNGWTTPGCGSLADYYPGDDIVDVIAISAYNFGSCLGSYQTPAQAMDPYLNEIRDHINDTKPFLIAQTASPRPSCGGNQSSWVRTMMQHLADDPNVVGFIWFNFNNSWETDWRVWTGTSLTSGWTQGVNEGFTTYTWPLTDWFAPGELTVGPPPPEVVPCQKGPCDSIAWVDSGSQWGLWDGLHKWPDVSQFYFGNPGDLPFMGDWDGDGVATPGLYRQSDGFVYLKNANTQGVADLEFFFGNPGDVPLVGDFDGDGRDSVSIWRPAEARVFIMNELGADGGGLGAADFDFYFGNAGDAPFVGDFDGDGIDTVGLYRESVGFVYFRNSLSTGVAHLSFFYGNGGDQILAGDWDGDGDDTVAVYRPSTGRVYMNLENTNGAADWDGYVGTQPYVLTAGHR